MLGRIKDRITGKIDSIKTKRSSQWPKLRKQHLLENPRCAACGGTAKLEVHHIKPFHLNPELELDLTNLITLCESWKHGLCCHLFAGHRGSYRTINPNVREDCRKLLATLSGGQIENPDEDEAKKSDEKPRREETVNAESNAIPRNEQETASEYQGEGSRPEGAKSV